ncbi:MAG: FGGY-family carbohydrate kinase, partial [Clostridia bacterium]|nr:FGGY-family carbohydrate kinase [Clostridia bacterium]
GITYEMAYNMEILDRCGIRIDELRAVGGGAKSSYWLRIKASITGCRIIALDIAEAGIVGAAMLAGVGLGAYGSVKEAEPLFIHQKPPIEPDPDENKIYAENYLRYKAAREAVAKLYG